jgi:hypothetical protein
LKGRIMARDVVVNFTTQDGQVDGTVVAGLFRVSISGIFSDAQEVAASPARFLAVAAGDYAGTVARLDDKGGILGVPLPFSFVVPKDQTVVALPVAVVVDVAPSVAL